MPSKIAAKDVAMTREYALLRVKLSKAAILAHLETGDRDFAMLRKLVDDYADAQNAADVLGGMTTVI